MKPLKLIATALGLAIAVSGYSTEQKKERKQDKEKAQRERTIQLSVYVTDINSYPIENAIVSKKNGRAGFGTNPMGEVTIFCGNIDTIIIYSTYPVIKIVGEVKVLDIIEDNVTNVWKKTNYRK